MIRIVALPTGVATLWDGQLVKAYNPSRHAPDGSYDGGLLEVTDDPKEALLFTTAVEAMEKWRETVSCCAAHATRPDGRPNRPLAAFSVEVMKAELAVVN